MPNVLFYPGDGTEYWIEVGWLSGTFPRNPSGQCAFCDGDPCAEVGGETLIAAYYKRNPHAETCPLCKGQPS